MGKNVTVQRVLSILLHRLHLIIASGIIFALKSGMGIGGAIAGLILSIFGYMSGIGNTQSETAVWGIRLVTSLVPALLFTMGVVVMYFYPITKSYNEKMQAELAHRRKMSASRNDK